uniref:Uncharacterized protein LOC111122958 isoform X2 n=1 Tax=Crassostrea virginica TaxID=6565 RepID=A0A8B8D1Q4_CRAVI|nr:uncharacterized protein LOC111122958 isoform X2 [Crassostrea virginica]
MDSRLLIFSLSIFIWDGGESCSYPEYIQNTTWRDNTKGRVTYGVNTMEGWAFTAFSQLISDWECFLSDNHFIVSRSSTTIKVFGAEVYAYLCQKPSLIGENAIYYYAMTDEEENAGKERVHVTAADVSEVCTVCNPKSSPTDEEFRVLLREGEEARDLVIQRNEPVRRRHCPERWLLAAIPVFYSAISPDPHPYRLPPLPSPSVNQLQSQEKSRQLKPQKQTMKR